MSARTARVFLALSAFVLGLACVFAIVLVIDERQTGSIANPAAGIGGPFQLLDQDGNPVTDQQFKGRPFLVFFGFTHCPDVCPTTLFELSQVLDKLGPQAAGVGALFVTVDPERDTPATLKDYLSSFNPHLTGLTGDPAAIAAMAKAYRVYFKKVPLDGGDYTMDHTALVYLMGRDGHFIAPFKLNRSADDAAADLKRYL